MSTGQLRHGRGYVHNKCFLVSGSGLILFCFILFYFSLHTNLHSPAQTWNARNNYYYNKQTNKQTCIQSVGVADNLILSLNGHRSDRVALLLSVFPVIHWGVLIALSFSLLFTFLLNSNQQVLQYLNSVQLRMLFAILVGVFSGTATLCINLADPFRGSFSVAEAAAQLGDLRLCLKQDVLEATAEEGEITSKVVHALLLGGRNYNDLSESDPVSQVQVSKELTEELARNGQFSSNSKDDQAATGVERTRNNNNNINDRTRRRYGLASTVYFHLLTGPLGSNARVLGDVIAWLATYVGSWTRAASNRMKKVLWFRTRPGSRSRSRPAV